MEEDYDNLIHLLEKSVEKNGEKPLTNKWLLNMLKMIQQERNKDFYESKFDLY